MVARLLVNGGRMRRAVRRSVWGLVPLVAVIIWATAPTSGQSGAKNGEWTTYGGDLGNTRYSPLDQINADNFSKLEVAWRFKTDNLGPRPEYTVRVDAADGQRRALLDRRHPPRRRRARRRQPARCCGCTASDEGQRGDAAPRQLSGRGLAYWTDGSEERILYVTPGYRLVALDAKTGVPIPSFGKDGVVDLKQDDDQVDRPDHRRDRPARRRRSSRATSSSSAPRTCRGGVPTQQDEREGLHPRVRRADRQAAVDLPHDSAAAASSATNVGERLVVVHRQHGRRGAQISVDEELGHGLPAGRDADRRLLRRPSARQQPVRREPRRRRSEDRASASGTTSSCTTGSGTTTSRARRSWSTSPSTDRRSRRSRSRPSRRSCTCSIASTGQPMWPIEERAGAEGRRARRMVFADAAVPARRARQAVQLRPQGVRSTI